MSVNKSPRPAIAVVGVSAIFPGSIDRTGFWTDIFEGKDLIGDIKESHWLLEDYYDPDMKARDKTYARRGAFLDDVDFDALSFGVPPSILEATDTSQLMALIVANRVLEDATRGNVAGLDKEKVSVVLGVTSAQQLLGTMVSRLQRPAWVKGLRESGLPEAEVQAGANKISDQYVEWQEATFPGLLGNVVAGRIANRLDLHGTNCVTDAACASAFSAVHMALSELYLGHSDMVITGGVDTMNDIFMYMCFSKTPALSKSGECRPFSANADGTLLGEGIGMVALKRLEDAERDCDNVYGVIRGLGTSSDGRSKSVYAPVPEGQARALRRTYEAAGYGADTVELVEAHGTGTVAGDAAEFAGLQMAFGETERKDGPWAALGSVKSQIGHTKAAAGAAGLFKMVMALHSKVLPPTIKVDKPNPKLDLDNGPFYLNTKSRPWVRGSDHPRRASVSSFGFGGSNFHITLEEYNGAHRAGRVRASGAELVLITGTDAADLASQCRDMANTLAMPQALKPGMIAFLAQSTQSSFVASDRARLAVIANSGDELVRRLTEAADRLGSGEPFALPNGTRFELDGGGKVALLFPGQGSQYLEMGAGVAMAFDEAMAAWDLAADLDLGDDKLHQVVFPQPSFNADADTENTAKLTATEWAQPAIGATSLSMLNLLEAMGLKADCAAGHSFGEVMALRAAGVLTSEQALNVARRRGELMAQAAQKPGSMTAVVADIDTVRERLDAWGIDVVVANHNHPTQVVLSGTVDAIRQVEAKLQAENLRFTRLGVATAFHSPIVADAAEPLRTFLEPLEIGEPTFPVYANSTAEPYPAQADGIRDTLAGQLPSPVRWVEIIENMYTSGVRVFVECGPGSVLTGLVGRILEGRPHAAVSLDRKGREGRASFYKGIGQLAVAGVQVDAGALWASYEEPIDPRTLPKPKLAIPIGGSNYGQVYPPKGGAAALPKPNPPRKPRVETVLKEVIKEVPVVVQPAAAPIQSVRAAAPGASAPVAQAAPAPQTLATAEWLSTFQQLQAQTAEAHRSYQQMMAQTHSAFLTTVESSFVGLSAMGGTAVAPAVTPPAPMAWAPAPIAAAPTPIGAAPIAAVPAIVVPPLAAVAAPEPDPDVVAVAPVAVAAPSAGLDLTQLLLDVVSDKTGYPGEMLSMEMSLEADLGVDSIKRVEILSGMREREPNLPEVDAGEMAALQTLGQIVEYMSASLPETPVAAATPMASPPTSIGVVAAGERHPVDMTALLLAVVADKTGYPAEMLNMDMSLEADLGVDSIKRVEILSGMREQEPSLPEVDAGEMAALQTLGQIVEYMKHSGGIVTSAPAGVAGAVSAAAPSVDLTQLLLDVVSDKTGYPSDMLNMDMSLEADLGVDSIKRVEILSGMREREPTLPEVDAGEMAALQTLGQIVEYMADQGGVVASAPAPCAPAAAGGLNLTRLLLDVVADKTGYPADMLNMDMSLEADLGVDSIKRVEILSGMREKEPTLPEVDAGEMASLQTLGQIVAYMNGGKEASEAEQAVVFVEAEAPAAVDSTTDSLAVDLTQLLLDVVSDKTGYPADMLNMDMSLEADLGVDSIKRVEILSGMREKEPSLPDVDASEMAALQTLGQIVAYMQDGTPAGAAPVVVTKAKASTEVGRFSLRLVPAPAAGMSLPGLERGQVQVIADNRGVSTALVRLLKSLGIVAIERDEPNTAAAAVIDLSGLSSFDTVDAAIAANKQVFYNARTIARTFCARGGLFVTVQDTGGDFGLDGSDPIRAWSGGIAGLAKTAALEWPEAFVKAIDCEFGGRTAEVVARDIARELVYGGFETEVALTAAGRRYRLLSEESPVAEKPVRLLNKPIVLASGGARGVTARTLIELAKDTGARVALLGRTALTDEPAVTVGTEDDAGLKRALLGLAQQRGEKLTPVELGRRVSRILANREINHTIEAIRAAGGDAAYYAVDVTDRVGVAGVVAVVEQTWGPVTGIVHGAGVLADKLIAEKTDEAFARVFDTKINGLRALLAATKRSPLAFLVMFSSVAARCGNTGQCDYAMANEVLNKVANAARVARGIVVKSLNWGPWEGGMVTPALKARFEAAGVPLVALDTGARMLVDELLNSSADQVELVLGGRPRPEALTSEGSPPHSSLAVRVHVSSHPFLESHTLHERPVVPVVLALEWFAQAARACRPDLHLATIRQVKVLKGIQLQHFTTTGDWYRIDCRQLENGHGATLQSTVFGADGTRHYSATIELTKEPRPLGVDASTKLLDLEDYTDEVYGDVLFHGPDFQVIRDMDGVSETGIAATLTGTADKGWPGDAWQVDAALLDGGLQLALLWADWNLGGHSLPTHVDTVQFYQHGTAPGPIHSSLKAVRYSGDKVVSDVVFVDADGRVVAEMRGVETTMLPGNSRAPGRERHLS